MKLMRPRIAAGPGAPTSLLAAWCLTLVACSDRPEPVSGVSWDLAEHRARTISDVRYELSFSIPDSVTQPVEASATIRFALADASQPVVLDFNAPAHHVRAVTMDGGPIPHQTVAGHLVIPARMLTAGENAVEIAFVAGDLSLNRNPDYLYTLFVPDRASGAFPCFDQPNLKATFRLTLVVPAAWQAVGNGPLESREDDGEHVTYRFGETKPISSYLFSFAAGVFQVESADRDGRLMRMFHRETDEQKVARNREAIFDLHAAAIEWLEGYTTIPYPFDKFDFVLVPAFQYGGMEHPGAILYRAASLLLDETATKNQLLGRASLIAHETAHMWFGDLVTMNWFDDVWTKEVFANFMAAKIVNPAFPDIDHELNFFLRHYPAAYAIDRTAGANPIRQPLANLKDAGTLYGAIIYQKAPIVMRQLERIVGETAFRDGMRTYLSAFAYGNATWHDLIAILDDRSPEDLRSWSETWVEQPERPTISTEVSTASGRIQTLTLRQTDPAGRERVWIQELRLLLGWRDSTWVTSVHLGAPAVPVAAAVGLPVPEYILASADGVGYGLFDLDSLSRDYLLRQLPTIHAASTRSAAWVTLWDALLEARVAPQRFVTLALTALPLEDDELNTQRVLAYLTTAFWRYLSEEARALFAPEVERTLWELMEHAPTTSVKASYLNAFRSVAITRSGVGKLERIWKKQIVFPDLPLSERDFTALAHALAVRGVPDTERILDEQATRIRNPDRRKEFTFVRPALSWDADERTAFFMGLRDPGNREHEPWVLRAVTLLHHPLRAQQAQQYIRPSLELLEEIQETGDIFFPKRWLDATLGGHNSPAAVAAVNTFLEEHPDYPPRLRLKILQSTDPVARAARIVHDWRDVP